ncbi:MAG: hypothetical protein ACRC1P_03825 [Cellulosilyticaceae bacterium]
MTNRQTIEIKKNLLEFLLLTCKEHPEEMYTYSLKLLEDLRLESIKKEKYLEWDCQLTIQS